MGARRLCLPAWCILAASSAACIPDQVTAPVMHEPIADFSAAAIGQLAPVSWVVRRPAPTSFRAAAAASDGERIYVFGGEDFSTLTSATRIYNPASNTWTTGASFSGARAFSMAAALPDGIHLVGGAGPTGLL